MSAPKHSPAPWWYDKGHCAIRYQLPPGHPDRYSDDPELDDGARNVVSLFSACGGDDPDADIAVMTAGPEMLAALRAVVACPQAAPWLAATGAYDAAVAAIAKAEGRA